MNTKATLGLVCLCLVTVSPLAQDERLLDITTVIVTPADEEMEIEVLKKKLETALGWTLTDKISEANAIWVIGKDTDLDGPANLSASGIYGGSGGGYGPPAGTRFSHPRYKKKVVIFTNSIYPEQLWETEHEGSTTISKFAIGQLKNTLEKLRKKKSE